MTLHTDELDDVADTAAQPQDEPECPFCGARVAIDGDYYGPECRDKYESLFGTAP